MQAKEVSVFSIEIHKRVNYKKKETQLPSAQQRLHALMCLRAAFNFCFTGVQCIYPGNKFVSNASDISKTYSVKDNFYLYGRRHVRLFGVDRGHTLMFCGLHRFL